VAELWISPSQIEAGRQCLRRWYKKHVEKFKEPDSASTALGTRVHKILEDYLRDAKPIDGTTPEGAIAQAGEVYLPKPGTGVIEGKFKLPVTSDFLWYGLIDWRAKDSSLIIDHKTTSDFKWVKPAAILLKDPQVLIYGAKGLIESDRNEQDLRWIYYRTKGAPKAVAVDIKLTRAQVEEGCDALQEEAECLIKLRRSKFLDLPPSPEACFDYGKPCPHRSECTDLDQAQRMRAIMKSREDVLADLKARAAGVAVTVAPKQEQPATTPPVQETKPAVPLSTVDPLDELSALMSGPSESLPSQAPAAPDLPMLPPDEEPTRPDAPIPKREAEEQAKPRGRGRPPGSKNKPKDGVDSPVNEASSAISEAASSAPVEEESTEENERPINVLYVDCVPLYNTTVMHFSDLAVDLHKGIKEELKLAHYMLAEFGSGVAVWSQAINMLLPHYKGVSVYVSSRTPEGRDALETLKANATHIIQGC
jgi:hypothetical protein